MVDLFVWYQLGVLQAIQEPDVASIPEQRTFLIFVLFKNFKIIRF